MPKKLGRKSNHLNGNISDFRGLRADFHRFFNMHKQLKIASFLITFYILHFTFYISANAQCPVCIVTIGGSVLLSRYLGIDDLIVGIWAGALILSSGLWTAGFIKRTFFKGQKWVLTVLLWITTVFGLKQAGFIGNPTCKIHGHDKLFTGIIAGTLVFLLAYGSDLLLRKLNKKNPGKVFFPYQRVVIPVVLLIIATLVGAKVCNLKF